MCLYHNIEINFNVQEADDSDPENETQFDDLETDEIMEEKLKNEFSEKYTKKNMIFF